VVFVLERESAGNQLQGKFFALGSVERWAAVARHQNSTPLPSPSGSGERWPLAVWEPLTGLLTEELPPTASIPDRPGYE